LKFCSNLLYKGQHILSSWLTQLWLCIYLYILFGRGKGGIFVAQKVRDHPTAFNMLHLDRLV